MKKALIITSIIVVLVLALTCLILTSKKTTNDTKENIQTEQVEQKTPVEVQKKVVPVSEPTMRDENDMPKSDVNVPEIG